MLRTANDGIVLHDGEVITSDDVSATSRRNEDLALRSSLLHGGDFVTGNGSLESIDGVDLGDDDTSTHTVKSLGATLANITEAGNDSDLASNHDIGGTLDTID